MSKFGLRNFAAAFAATLGLVIAVKPASATSIYVSALELSNGYEIVSMNENGTIQTGIYAGQMDVTANFGTSLAPGSAFQMYAWCVDFYHDIYLGGDSDVYTLAPVSQIDTDPPSGSIVTSAQAAKITWLASYGDSMLAADGANGELSAAVQIAIWNTEYGYTYAGGDSTLSADLSNLESLYATDPGAYPVDPHSVALLSINPDGSLAQGLIGVNPAPEPASFALLASGLLALGALCRRRAGRLPACALEHMRPRSQTK